MAEVCLTTSADPFSQKAKEKGSYHRLAAIIVGPLLITPCPRITSKLVFKDANFMW